MTATRKARILEPDVCEMKTGSPNKLRLYKITRTALLWFALFSFGMGGYAYLNEIGSISQVVQASAFGAGALLLRFTVFSGVCHPAGGTRQNRFQ